MSTKDILRIGVIGAGGRGTLADYAHHPDRDAALVAGCDIRDAALDDFRKKYPDAFLCKDYRELLDKPEIDAVFVCTPDYLHEEHALAALDAGKHVYLEKPMTITVEGCDRVLRKAYEKKRKLYLGHNMRHMSFVLRMKQLIDDGAIGEVKAGWCRHFVSYGGDAYFKDWHAERRNTTGLLLQKGAHDIDILHWLCGGYSKRVVGVGGLTLYDRITDRHDPSERGDATFVMANWPPLSQKQLNPVIGVEDISMMLMELDNGVFASYQQCHFTPDGWRNYVIIGTQGRIENLGDCDKDTVIGLWNKRYDGCKVYGDNQFPTPPSEGGHGGCDPAIVAEFIRYVREGGKIHTSPIAARNSVAAGCMATYSLRNGAVPMDIPAVDPEVEAHFNADLMK